MRLKIKQALQNYIKMKQIKAFALLLGVVVLASCASQKRVIYLQDAQADAQLKIAQDYQIRRSKYASNRWTA